MKKIYFLLLMVFICFNSFSQGTETFENFTETGSSYATGTFTGNDGSTWNYVQSRGDQSITDKSIMLGKDRTPQSEVFSGTISGGIGTISFNYKRAFSTNVNLNILVNDIVVGNVVTTDATVQNSGAITVNQAGNVVIKFVNLSGGGQVTIDDITWTGLSTSCGVTFGTASYTCNANTVGDNNDSVTINIPYTGSDAAITDVTTTSAGSVGGDDPATVANGTITISGLSEGDAWDIALVGGDCGIISASGMVASAECDPIPTTCFDLSNGTEPFELVTVTLNSSGNEWTNSSGSYNLNGFCGGGCQEPIEGWLVFGPLDMTGVSDLALAFNATEAFGTTDLVVAYSNAYSGCPSGTSWTTAQTITDAGAINIDLSAASGTNVFIGIQYADDGTDGYSNWTLTNVALNAFGSCPTLGARPTSNCAVCDLALQSEAYVCLSNTEGTNNDSVTIEIPYTGSENSLTSVTTSSAGIISGDDPMTISDGTILITGLSEGDAWDLTLNGGDCNGTTISGTIPATACDPTFLIINEIQADPDATNGDANGDGTINTGEDEFIEIFNSGTTPIDLENYTISDASSVRHVFPSGTILMPNTFITVFGGGTPTGISYISQISSTGSLGFNNSGDTVTLKDAGDITVVSLTYGSDAGDNQSIGRNPDFTGEFVKHSTISSNPVLFSPGAKNDGTTLSTESFSTTTFNVYPNPTTNGFVNITSPSSEAISVIVYDVLGKQVLNNNTISNNSLNVSSLNSGMYILRISQNGNSVTKKLVIK